MFIFGRKDSEDIRALKTLNDELRRMYGLLYNKACNSDIDMTKTELMDRIIKLQDTLNEGVRKICGLEY